MWKSEDTSYDGAPNCPVIALLRDSSHVETVNDSPQIEEVVVDCPTQLIYIWFFLCVYVYVFWFFSCVS